jgi:toxin FitB
VYLLDTDIVSELRKPRRNENVTAWVEPVATADLYVSLISIVEIERGIERQRHIDPAFAQVLAAWLDALLRLYGERILPVTITIARRWGKLSAQLGNTNLDLGIAATALEHGLTVVTRNVAHYGRTGVAVVNPFETKPRRR